MIIGISGKIGSGKDTVGKIIQVLCFLEKINIKYSYAAFEHNLNKNFNGDNYYGEWHIKKFAKKLKQIVVLLTACTLEQLEDQDFKNRSLGPEWEQDYRYTTYGELSDADKLRVGHNMPDDHKVAIAEKWIPTYRWLLQQLGTEAIRDTIHTNAWVNALFADHKPLGLNHEIYKSIEDKNNLPNEAFSYPNWIITDMRFPNELKAIQDRKGITLRINRWDLSRGTIQQQKEWSKVNAHFSETALDEAQFDFTIENDGTMQELVEKVRLMLLDAKILKAA